MVRNGNPQADQACPILYSFRRCPYAMRARLALAISETSCIVREVKLSAKPAALLAASPKGTVPVCVLADGTVLDESLDIMRWALAMRDPEGWLSGEDRDLIAQNDGPFKHALDRYKYAERYAVDPLSHRGAGLDFMRQLETRLSVSTDLSGPTRSMTDAAILPFVRQFAAVDRIWFSEQPLPHLKSWMKRHVSSELFDGIMTRVAPWVPGDPPIMLVLPGVA